MGAACATTHPLGCPYNEERPHSDDGIAAWQLFLDNAWRVIAGMSGVTGFDLGIAQRRLVDAGAPVEVAEDLLAACASAALKAMHEKEEDADG